MLAGGRRVHESEKDRCARRLEQRATPREVTDVVAADAREAGARSPATAPSRTRLRLLRCGSSGMGSSLCGYSHTRVLEEARLAVPESSEDSSRSGFGANEWLVDEMYERYQKDPNSVDKVWWDFFGKDQRGSRSASSSTTNGAQGSGSGTVKESTGAPKSRPSGGSSATKVENKSEPQKQAAESKPETKKSETKPVAQDSKQDSKQDRRQDSSRGQPRHGTTTRPATSRTAQAATRRQRQRRVEQGPSRPRRKPRRSRRPRRATSRSTPSSRAPPPAPCRT